jgi:hypothetical protein
MSVDFGKEVVGMRCMVFFDVESGKKKVLTPFPGTVKEFKYTVAERTEESRHRIEFEDGDVMWFDLGELDAADRLWWKTPPEAPQRASEASERKRKDRPLRLANVALPPTKKLTPTSAAPSPFAGAEAPGEEDSDEGKRSEQERESDEEEDSEEDLDDDYEEDRKLHARSSTVSSATDSADAAESPIAIQSGALTAHSPPKDQSATKESGALAAAVTPERKQQRRSRETVSEAAAHLPAWLREMEAWLEEVPHGPKKKVVNRGNAAMVMRQVRKLCSGGGIGYINWPPDVVFYEGIPVTLEFDFARMLREAKEIEEEWGEDKGHGWLLRHPIKKLMLFKEYYKTRPREDGDEQKHLIADQE